MHSRESFSLVLISAASLAYEICLTRIFAVQQFHNFAFVVISLAVMGFAASGIALSLSRRQPGQHILASSFALSVTLAYIIIDYLPFDSYSIAWDRTQIWILLIYFFAAGIPFLFAGWFIGQALSMAGEFAYRPYAANLMGSALGCLIALITLQVSSEEGGLGISIALGWLTTAVAVQRLRCRILFILLASMVSLAFFFPIAELQLRLSPYKPLSIARQFADAQILTTKRNASARVDILKSSSLHSYPGLSLIAPAPNFEQIGLFLDGEGPYPLTNANPEQEQTITFAQHMPAGLAYILRPGADALIIDPGTGLSAHISLALGAGRVHLPVDQPLITELMMNPYRAASGNILAEKRIQLIGRSSRGALSLAQTEYSIVEWALSDPFHPITSGAFSLTEDYLLTKEAFEQGWQRLTPDGLMVITRWIGTPPSEATRAWSTLLHALERQGVSDPGPHLAAYRGMRTATILVSKQPYNAQELKIIRAFLNQNLYDPIFLPDIKPSEINRHNQLPNPVYYQIFRDLLEDPQETIRTYEFRLEPTSDDRPYFFHFFRWTQSSEVLATLGVLWQPFGGSGYFVLLAMLALMLLLATPLVILPWVYLLRGQGKARPAFRVWLYFGGLGAGFMFVEVPLIIRLSLFLDYPVLAFGVVLFTLLLASGLGSISSWRIPLRMGLPVLCGLLITNVILLPVLIQEGLALPLWLRVVCTVLWLAPTGFFMGIPFAAGLGNLEAHAPGLIPWAWAINGAASGLSGVLATLALLDIGFRVTVYIGIFCYAIALVTIGRWKGSS
jgi:hypothetical protein